jgi:hypothetical protein
VAVRHPETNQFHTLDRAIDYDDGDPLVTEYPWAFATREAAPKGATVEDKIVTAIAVPAVKQPAKKAAARRK